MSNYERYRDIHNEIINRLQIGKITTEQAREVNNLAFSKYIVEAVSPVAIPIAIIGGLIAKTIYDVYDIKQQSDRESEREKIKREKKNKEEVDSFVSNINSKKVIFTLDDKELKIDTIEDVFKYVESDIKTIINYIKKDSKYKQKIKDSIEDAITKYKKYIEKNTSNKDDIDKKIDDYRQSLETFEFVFEISKTKNSLLITIVDGEQEARIVTDFILDDVAQVINTKYSKVFNHFNMILDTGDGDEGSINLEVKKS